MNYDDFKAKQTKRLKEVFNTLGSEDMNVEDVKNAFTGILTDQSEYGKSQYDKKHSQIKKFETVLGAIGYDENEYSSVKDFAESFKNEKNTIDTKTSKYQEMELRLAKMEKETEERVKATKKLKSDNDKATMTSKLQEAIGDKLIGSKYVIKDLLNEGKVKLIDGDVVFMDGEDVVLFDDGINSVMTENEDAVINKQVAGVNTVKGNKVSNAPTGLTLEEINKMSPEQLKVNMAEIKKAAKSR